jgi:hypothetical protein
MRGLTRSVIALIVPAAFKHEEPSAFTPLLKVAKLDLELAQRSSEYGNKPD